MRRFSQIERVSIPCCFCYNAVAVSPLMNLLASFRQIFARSGLNNAPPWVGHIGGHAVSTSTVSFGASPVTSARSQQGSRPVSGAQTVLAAGAKVVGDVTSEASIEIHGHVEGEIRSSAEVVVSESAVVTASITSAVVRVYGRVDGNIRAADLLELKSGACVTGSLSCPRVIMEDGVVFEGTCSMTKQESEKNRANS